jgi:hypothetical protein
MLVDKEVMFLWLLTTRLQRGGYLYNVRSIFLRLYLFQIVYVSTYSKLSASLRSAYSKLSSRIQKGVFKRIAHNEAVHLFTRGQQSVFLG